LRAPGQARGGSRRVGERLGALRDGRHSDGGELFDAKVEQIACIGVGSGRIQRDESDRGREDAGGWLRAVGRGSYCP
jgi:hypothetical protein